jgi:hypothetical protein
MQAKWIASVIVASGLTTPAFAQVGQAPARIPEITAVAAGPDASQVLPFAPMVHEMSISTLPPRRKYGQVIVPDETAQQLTSTHKMIVFLRGGCTTHYVASRPLLRQL